MKERYGVDNAMQNKGISTRSHNTAIERYGIMPWNNESTRLKHKKTHLERYGVPYGIMCKSNDSTRISNIKKVKKSDIVKAFRKVHMDTVFLLEGVLDEED